MRAMFGSRSGPTLVTLGQFIFFESQFLYQQNGFSSKASDLCLFHMFKITIFTFLREIQLF